MQGRTVSFKNTIEVMTSNMGSQDILAAMQTDPDSVKARVMSQARHPSFAVPWRLFLPHQTWQTREPTPCDCYQDTDSILQRVHSSPYTVLCFIAAVCVACMGCGRCWGDAPVQTAIHALCHTSAAIKSR